MPFDDFTGLWTDPPLDYAEMSGPGAFDEFGSMTGPGSDKTIFGGTVGDPFGTKAMDAWLRMIGNVGAGGLGVYASGKQAKSLADLAEKYSAYGAPSRVRYESSFAPGFTMSTEPGYNEGLELATKEAAHRASAEFANPSQSPNAWTRILQEVHQKYAQPAIAGYRDQNAATGGYGAFSTAAPGAATAAIGARRGVYDAAGAGLADLLHPALKIDPRDLELLRQYAQLKSLSDLLDKYPST